MTLLTSTLGPKGQITLPKKIRQSLGVTEPGDLVGFMLDEKSGLVRLAKMKVSPANEEAYTEKELKKLLKISKSKTGKYFESVEAFLKDLQKL